MTEASRVRGTVVHSLCAAFDLGAVEQPASVTSEFKGYLLGHVAAMTVLKFEILAVEEPLASRAYRFAGRPDRLVNDRGMVGPLEIKSGEPTKAHPVQTALQALLAEETLLVPAEHQQRLALYLKPNGRFRLEEHRDRGDFVAAREILRACCGGL